MTACYVAGLNTLFTFAKSMNKQSLSRCAQIVFIPVFLVFTLCVIDSGVSAKSQELFPSQRNLLQLDPLQIMSTSTLTFTPAYTLYLPLIKVKRGYQYYVTDIAPVQNPAITQIIGGVTDRTGRPLDGVRIQARSALTCKVSYPSGLSGVYPAGRYDVLLLPFSLEESWYVSVVDKPTETYSRECDPTATKLSDEVMVTTTVIYGVVNVDFSEY